MENDQDDQQPDPEAVPLRKPKQARSLARYNLLLDAAHDLLETQEPQDLGIYQVAKQAGIPPASAYHLFPTPGAIVMALAGRYQLILKDRVSQARPPADGMWQTLLKDHMAGVVRLYNGNLPMMKVMVGNYARHGEDAHGEVFLEGMADALERTSWSFFYMPVVRDARRRFLVLLTLIDSIWSLSYDQHGRITQDYEAEAAAAAVAYCRTFLPEYVELRKLPSSLPQG